MSRNSFGTLLRTAPANVSVRHAFIFAGPVYHNALKNCAALSCRALRRVARMCSRTLSVNCEYFTKHTQRVTRLPFPFSQRSHVGNLRQTLQEKRETGVHKRVETVGVYPLAPRRGRGESPRSAERNSPLDVQAKNLPPVRGEHACAVQCAPVSPVQKKVPPGQRRSADAPRMPRKAGGF